MMLDDGGIITAIASGAINIHDLELLMTTPMLKPGDTLLVEPRLKKERRVDVIIPLRSDMLAYGDSLTTAYHPGSGSWEKHPTREG